jgi:hypothetical protein
MNDEIELTPPDAFAMVASLVALAAEPRSCGKRLEELRRVETNLKKLTAELAADRAAHEKNKKETLAWIRDRESRAEERESSAFHWVRVLQDLLREYRQTGQHAALDALPPECEQEVLRIEHDHEAHIDAIEKGTWPPKPYEAPADLATVRFDAVLDERSAGDGLRTRQ